jgi:hypothetical protein
MTAQWRRSVLALLAGLCACSLAAAALGEAADSVHRDQVRMMAMRRQANALRYQVHTLSTADGSAIKEFVTTGGAVFAVVWHTRFKPDFGQLLGRHHPTYVGLAQEAIAARPGIHRHLSQQRGDLVVTASGFLNNFSGRAYLVSLLPQGVNLDEIR